MSPITYSGASCSRIASRRFAVEARRPRPRHAIDQQRVLRDREDVRAVGLAVPARDAGEPVRDVLDLDVKRRGVEQVEPAARQHALPGAGGKLRDVGLRVWEGWTYFILPDFGDARGSDISADGNGHAFRWQRFLRAYYADRGFGEIDWKSSSIDSSATDRALSNLSGKRERMGAYGHPTFLTGMACPYAQVTNNDRCHLGVLAIDKDKPQ